MSENSSAALRVDGRRLWDALAAFAEIGATPRGGCNRQALTDVDRAGRDRFASSCVEAGLDVRCDAMGNLFARRAGSDDTLAPVMAGSHLDTQPTGGRFDGVYGVLAGLEVVRTLNDAAVTTRRPLEIVSWTNEEGARFAPAMLGSGVWGGEFELDYAHARTDRDGLRLGDELARIGYLGDAPCRAGAVFAAFEAHIEQGPILEQAATTIGVVTGVQGMRWYDVVLEGASCHAGPTPMALRRDPVAALGPITSALYALAAEHAPWARVTFGDLRAEPGARNTVPERVVLAVDLRHPEPDTLAELDAALRETVASACAAHRVTGRVELAWDSPAVRFDAACVDAVERAARVLDLSHMRMVSGAGHDSVYVARVAPTAMIFVPCEGGLSHNEAENAAPADLEAGANVLLHAMLERANA